MIPHFLLLLHQKCVKSILLCYPDPHVKVEGKRANVLEAKKKILELLETKVRVVNKCTEYMFLLSTQND